MSCINLPWSVHSVFCSGVLNNSMGEIFLLMKTDVSFLLKFFVTPVKIFSNCIKNRFCFIMTNLL